MMAEDLGRVTFGLIKLWRKAMLTIAMGFLRDSVAGSHRW